MTSTEAIALIKKIPKEMGRKFWWSASKWDGPKALKEYASSLMDAAPAINREVLDTREIDDTTRRQLARLDDMLARYKKPKDINQAIIWFMKMEEYLKLLANSLDAPMAETVRAWKIGPFILRDGIGIPDEVLDAIKGTIEKVIRGISQIAVPGFASILYGDVTIVPRFSGGRNLTIAYYQSSNDTVYIRGDLNRTTEQAMKTLAHELAHRYWQKKASPRMKKEWNAYHRSTLQSGEFPTEYASKSPEEHFCEAVGMKIIGKLKGDNEMAFNRIVSANSREFPLTFGNPSLIAAGGSANYVVRPTRLKSIAPEKFALMNNYAKGYK